jgi:hypothetical protein
MDQIANPPQRVHCRTRLGVAGLCIALMALAASVLSPCHRRVGVA